MENGLLKFPCGHQSETLKKTLTVCKRGVRDVNSQVTDKKDSHP